MEDTLSEAFTQCWAKLLYGSIMADNALHTGTVGTLGTNGINLRTVVLRAIDPDKKQVIFYTDKRSAKMADIAEHPQLSWLFYDAAEKIQIRLSGQAVVHHNDDIALYHWENVSKAGRKSYMAIPAPSTGIANASNGLEYLAGNDVYTVTGYHNYAVIITCVNFIEWLSLKPTGHRRAQFKFTDDSWKGQWLVP
ncbi:pyridoxine/pyridoxamine 5'-phosphate oxidase [Mucilaginibacter gracilis]|uniref:Pyridoxine/pyridoxamine 5'-phosphate oxidase n=1 Tax=Mucilaginibacter gracilis TaxID=423350 RepID=A0A495JAZ0_9SPHI|nr:pyridoxamine 5'-phosphate oxidase family protein [Mucilaginibacter gracilis]RKR85522.1 pyridoxine/pyridoxamine 5'-phosphate oxidase [Mucilaginibacter gracilis]